METKELKVGDYIRGFKVNHGYPRYEELVGKIGQVIEVSNNNQIKVRFNNCEMYYPKHIAIDHLCNEDMEIFEKGLDANAKEFLKPLETSVIDKTIEEMVKDAEDPLEDTPFHKPDFSHLLDLDKVLEKGIKNSGLNDKPIEELEEHFKDNINPLHYKNKPKETIERIKDNLTPEEFKGYLKGNILKYLDRYENKNGMEDLKKMQWYLNKLIEIENGKA